MIATCMAWLNDVKAGGGTAFIHPGEELLIEGRKGSMAFWIDTKANTQVLPNASHGGCPVSIKSGLGRCLHARTRDAIYGRTCACACEKHSETCV